MLFALLFLMASPVIQPEGATAPSRQPQLASAHGLVGMTFGSGTTIYFTASTDGGRTFNTPSKVADTAALALGRHRGPRVAIVKDAIVISAISGHTAPTGPHVHGKPQSGDLAVWRSTDRGKTWTYSTVINDVPGSAREGLHAMVSRRDGTLFAAWLDLRNKGTQLYGARSTDGGLTWSKNVLVYASPERTICECCHPTLSVDDKGRFWAMWRNVLDGSRDLYATSSDDGIHFEPAERLGTGTWKLNACPMDGGGLVVDSGKVISAWRRDSDVFLSEGGSSEKKIGTGKDVAIAHGKRGAFVAWSNSQGLQILAPNAAAPAVLAAEGAFVNLVRLQDGSVLGAWEANGSIETKRLD
jgi:hypothetical protein